MLVLIGYNEMGAGGHYGIALTGLGKKSCFLHMHAQPRDSYPKHKYIVEGGGLYKKIKYRYCFPTLEDGNNIGLSETAALEYWRYYKYKRFIEEKKLLRGENKSNLWEETSSPIVNGEIRLGRQKTISAKYGMDHNCVHFANRLLKASMLKTMPNHFDQIYAPFENPELNFSDSGSWIGNYHIPTNLFVFAKELLKNVYNKIKTTGNKVIYGIKLESKDFNSLVKPTTMNSLTRYYYEPVSNIDNEKKLDKELGIDNNNYLIRNLLHENSPISIDQDFFSGNTSNKELIKFIDDLYSFGKIDDNISMPNELKSANYGYSALRAFQKSDYPFRNNYGNKFNEKTHDSENKNTNNSKFFNERSFCLKNKDGRPLTILELEKIFKYTDKYWTL